MKEEMDLKLETMQFLGMFGILQEAYKIIFTRRKIFSQITLFLIFPISFFFLAYTNISNNMSQNFVSQMIVLTKSQRGLPRSIKLSDLIVVQTSQFFLFIIAYNVFLTIISIPFTSVATFVVACICTSGEVSFKSSLKVLTKVWKRVLVTSLNSLALSFTYDLVASCVLLLILRVILFRYRLYGHIIASILIVFMVVCFVGSVYLNTIWMLSKVVSVLDESYGFKALMKSQKLLRGKMVVAMIIFLFFMSSSVGVHHFLYNKLVVRGVVFGMIGKGFMGFLCLVLLIHLLLLKVVVLTVLYFICKSYHRENIDMSNLSGLVEIYMSLKANDVQIETEKALSLTCYTI